MSFSRTSLTRRRPGKLSVAKDPFVLDALDTASESGVGRYRGYRYCISRQLRLRLVYIYADLCLKCKENGARGRLGRYRFRALEMVVLGQHQQEWRDLAGDWSSLGYPPIAGEGIAREAGATRRGPGVRFLPPMPWVDGRACRVAGIWQVLVNEEDVSGGSKWYSLRPAPARLFIVACCCSVSP
jgi:hypothetical protein